MSSGDSFFCGEPCFFCVKSLFFSSMFAKFVTESSSVLPLKLKAL